MEPIEYIFAFLLAIAAPLVWIGVIYLRDRNRREPFLQLALGFGYGILTAIATLQVLRPIIMISGIDMSAKVTTFGAVLFQAFCLAAIPEELFKYHFLTALTRENKHFDEHMDGIVYCVSIGMGFAAAENLLYLFSHMDNWVTVGIARSLLSVPAHYAFAVLMGYYYSLVFFKTGHTTFNRIAVFLVPIMCHGIYDTAVMSFPLLSPFGLILVLLVIVSFCILMHVRCSKRIEEHLQRDIPFLKARKELTERNKEKRMYWIKRRNKKRRLRKISV